MESLLQHLVEITSLRDHVQLEKSIVSTLHQLFAPERVRILEIFRFRDDMFTRQKIWTDATTVISAEDAEVAEQPKELLTNYPVLMNCIGQREASAQEVNADNMHVLWLPVWLNEKVTACLEIRQTRPYENHLLVSIFGIFNVYRNYVSLLDYSERDSLTGLYNRKTFEEKFARMAFPVAPNELQILKGNYERRHTVDVKTQWLAIVDIDNFKLINDRFGHLYGDEVLILLGNLLRSSFRSYDRVFRFGGEEFVILLRSTTQAAADKVFERFRQKVEQYHFPQVGKVTISLGYASISTETPSIILSRADKALYYAKAHGRNQVFFYDDLINSGKLQVEVSKDDVELF